MAYTSSVIALAWPSIRRTAFTLAPALTAKLAAECRKSCGVIDGKESSAFRHCSTAGPNAHAPVGLPPHAAAVVGEHQIFAALADHQCGQLVGQRLGEPAERRSHVFGMLHTRPPDSVADRDTLTRLRSMSKSLTRSAAISPHRRPV